MSNLEEYTFYVKGMHCASCEVLIEKRLLEIEGIESVDASVGENEVIIEYQGKKPDTATLNKIFKKESYQFFEEFHKEKEIPHKKNILFSFAIALLLIIGFIIFQKLAPSGLVNVDSKSSLPTLFIFGLLAGVSSCAALIGGIILSMSKQWGELYSDNNSLGQKIQPHFLFNLGRLISYAILGAGLGAIGSSLKFSLTFSSFLVIGVSIIMVFLGFQMLGVKTFQKFQITLPKFIIRYIANESHFKGHYLPFLMGALTFFLPCGFTITAQGLALLSGNALQGGLIMFLFALGTFPGLFFIGLSSVKFLAKPHLSSQFLRVAGFLVLFFALYNVNFQLNALGFSILDDINLKSILSNKITDTAEIDEFPPLIEGRQVIKMDALASGYSPNYFKVRVGLPVRWEITDKGTNGCTNAVISKYLFDGPVNLTPGRTAIKEFTPTKPGKYKFSCWMGMITGTFEVVDVKTSKNSDDIISSGASGCGCGGCSKSTCCSIQ